LAVAQRGKKRGKLPCSAPAAHRRRAWRAFGGRGGAGWPARAARAAHEQGPAQLRPAQARGGVGDGGAQRQGRRLAAARGGGAVPAVAGQEDRGMGRRDGKGGSEASGRSAAVLGLAPGRPAAAQRRRHGGRRGVAVVRRR